VQLSDAKNQGWDAKPADYNCSALVLDGIKIFRVTGYETRICNALECWRQQTSACTKTDHIYQRKPLCHTVFVSFSSCCHNVTINNSWVHVCRSSIKLFQLPHPAAARPWCLRHLLLHKNTITHFHQLKAESIHMYSSSWKPISKLWSITCHIGSLSYCHPDQQCRWMHPASLKQVHLLLCKYGRLSWTGSLVINRGGLQPSSSHLIATQPNWDWNP